MCNPAWLKRAEAAAAVKNEIDFLHYSIRAGDSKALDMRECPLRWLRLSQWCFPWGQEQSRIRVGGRCSNRWSKRLSLLFPLSLLPYSFVKLDGNMSVCLLSLWGFFYFKHGNVQQHLERHGGKSCNIYIWSFQEKELGSGTWHQMCPLQKKSVLKVEGARQDLQWLSDIKIWTFVINKNK